MASLNLYGSPARGATHSLFFNSVFFLVGGLAEALIKDNKKLDVPHLFISCSGNGLILRVQDVGTLSTGMGASGKVE